MGVLVIITKGRLSVMTLKSRPYKYVWNRCIPNTIDNSSRSIRRISHLAELSARPC